MCVCARTCAHALHLCAYTLSLLSLTAAYVCVCLCTRALRLYMCAYILHLLVLAAVYVYVCSSYVFFPSGSWTKLPRSLRMRDKRADFVVGSLGGNIVAVGGLGKSAELRERRYEAEKSISRRITFSRLWGQSFAGTLPICKSGGLWLSQLSERPPVPDWGL